MRTDRWNKKRELNLYAFYDHTGLERHLEKMAANGWMLESVGTYALRYRRCEPKKLRFAVVYYPKTDSFCPDEPNHENLTFWDYCAGAGWQIVTQRDDTHIFYNEDLDAVPIVARQFFCETRTEFLRKNSPVLRSKSETRSLASTAPKMEGAAHVKGRVLAWGGAAFAAPPLAFCPCGSSYSSVASPASSAASWAATGSVYSDQP